MINEYNSDPITLDSNYENISKYQTRAEGYERFERSSETLYPKHIISGYMSRSFSWMLSL